MRKSVYAAVGVIGLSLLPVAARAEEPCEARDQTGELVATLHETTARLAPPERCLEAAKAWVVKNYYPGEDPVVVEGVDDDRFGFWNPITNQIHMAPMSDFVEGFGERDALMWYVGVLAHEMEHRAQGRVANSLRIFDLRDTTHARIEEFESHVRRYFKAEDYDPQEFCAGNF